MAAAQIIKFHPPHDTATDDGNRIDIGRIERENTLNAFTEADLPHGEAGAKGPVGTGDTNAFLLLNTGTLTFDDAHADAERVARAEKIGRAHVGTAVTTAHLVCPHMT